MPTNVGRQDAESAKWHKGGYTESTQYEECSLNYSSYKGLNYFSTYTSGPYNLEPPVQMQLTPSATELECHIF